MPQIGLITVHGMGQTKNDYAEDFFDELSDRLGEDRWNEIATAPVYYQDIMQDNQAAYYRRVRRKVDWEKLRKFVLYGFCDAASLESQKEGEDSPYFIAQSRILEAFRDLYQDLGHDAPVVAVTQSLGAQVLSNYLWDAWPARQTANGVWSVAQNFDSPEEESFCRGRTINRLYTTGCNIPIFVAGRDPNQIFPIERPNDSFQWHNYYDEDDVLGWPLRDLNDDYRELVRDHKINSGLVSGFTPLSHVNYWSDGEFLKPLARHLRRLT